MDASLSCFPIAVATADLTRATAVIANVLAAPLRTKCLLVEAVVATGKPVDQLTVRELVELVQGVSA